MPTQSAIPPSEKLTRNFNGTLTLRIDLIDPVYDVGHAGMLLTSNVDIDTDVDIVVEYLESVA